MFTEPTRLEADRTGHCDGKEASSCEMSKQPFNAMP